jgi:hypothetical protein
MRLSSSCSRTLGFIAPVDLSMKTRSTIQILVSALLLTAVIFFDAYSQDPLPVEKKRALHRFDPADIFPEEREAPRSRGRRRPRNEGNAPSAASANPASSSARLRSINPAQSPTPTPRASGATVNPSPAPTLAPTPVLQTAPSITPTPEATPPINAMAAVQSPDLSPAVASGGQTDGGEGAPLYFLLPMLALILFALIVLIVSLKKQLRTP